MVKLRGFPNSYTTEHLVNNSTWFLKVHDQILFTSVIKSCICTQPVHVRVKNSKAFELHNFWIWKFTNDNDYKHCHVVAKSSQILHQLNETLQHEWVSHVVHAGIHTSLHDESWMFALWFAITHTAVHCETRLLHHGTQIAPLNTQTYGMIQKLKEVH